MTPPDGSTNRSVAGKLTALRNHLRVFGLAETTRAVLAHFGLSHRPAQDQFDSRHDVSTEGEIEVGDSDIPGPARAHAIKYQPTHEKVLADVLARLPGVREETVFVDLGSGKGRVLVAAAREPYRKIVGVELSAAYCEDARQNVAGAAADARCRDVEVLCVDVREYDFPETPLILYLFNPFEAPVLESVLERLKVSLARSPRDVWVAYCNPGLGQHVLDQAGFVRLSETPVIVPEWTWSLWHASGPARSRPSDGGQERGRDRAG